MYPSTARAAGRRNPSAIASHSHRDARATDRVAGDLRYSEPEAATTEQETRGVGEARRGLDDGRRGTVDTRVSTAVAAWSGIDRVLMATRHVASMVAALRCVRPVPGPARLTHLETQAAPPSGSVRIDPDLDLPSVYSSTDDKRPLRVAGAWAPLDPILRPCVGASSDGVERPPCLPCAIGSVESQGQIQPRGGRGDSDGPRAALRGIHRSAQPPGGSERHREPPRAVCVVPTAHARPVAVQKSPWGTPRLVTPEPASEGTRACRRVRMRDVDGAGGDRRQHVDGRGDEVVDSALRRSVAP